MSKTLKDIALIIYAFFLPMAVLYGACMVLSFLAWFLILPDPLMIRAALVGGALLIIPAISLVREGY